MTLRKVKTTKRLRPKTIKQSPPFISHYISITVLLLTTLVFFHEQIFGLESFWSSYWSDFTEIYVPFIKLNLEAIETGGLPFWNPYAYGGTVHLAETQTLYFYPLFYPLYCLFSSTSNIIGLLAGFIILHFFIIQLNIYALANYLKISRLSSLLVAISFTFSCAIVCRFQMLVILFTLSWFPILLLYLLKVVDRQGKLYHNIALIALFTSLSFLGGHPQYFFYNILFAGVLIFFYSMLKLKKANNLSGKSLSSNLFPLLIGFVLGILIIMGPLLLTIETIPLTNRSAITYEFASDGSFQFKQFLSFFSPFVYGYFKGGDAQEFATYFATPGKIYNYWETAYYFGVIPLLLAFWGIYTYFKKTIGIALIAVIILGFLHGFGSNSLLFPVLFELPGFSSFRIPSRTILYAVLALTLFAGFGVDKLFLSKKKKRDLPALGIITIVSLCIGLIFAFLLPSTLEINKSYQPVLASYGYRIIGYTLVFSLLCFYAHQKRKFIIPIVSLFIIISFIDLCSYNKYYKNSTVDQSKAMDIQPGLLERIKSDPKDLYRYEPISRKQRILKRNQATFLEIYGTDGFYGMNLKSQSNIPKGWPSKDLMSIKYITEIVSQNGQRSISFKDRASALKHARMTYQVEKLSKVENSFDKINFNNITVLAEDIEFSSSALQPSQVNHTIDIQDYSTNNIKVQVSTDQEGLLVLAEKWFPSWKAFIDGQPTEVYKANLIARGVLVPVGQHLIEFKFISPAFNIGKWISICGIVLLLSLFSFSFLKRKQYI